MQSPIDIRPLATHAEYAACVALQRETWGEQFGDAVPASILMVSQKVGGVTAGAFDDRDRLVGFVFGLTGVKDGRLAHWSDMLAVRPEWRDAGVGRALKDYQRQTVRALGVEVMYWTYDPLVARNAHLNINKLGARPVEYVVDMYGADTGSDLHRGIGSDRFIVAWTLANDWTTAQPSAGQPPTGAARTIEIPADIAAVQARSLSEAAAWRSRTRHAFLSALGDGLVVTGFRRGADGLPFYLLDRPDADSR